MGGSDGSQAGNVIQTNDAYKILQQNPSSLSSPGMQQALSDYSSGKTDLAGALKAAQGDTSSTRDTLNQRIAAAQAQMAYEDQKGNSKKGNIGVQESYASLQGQVAHWQDQLNQLNDSDLGSKARENQIFVDPQTANLAAAQQVQSNPLLSGMFGKGGINDQRQAQESELASRGYSLQPEDYEAYGQASDQIARQYGNMENNLGQALSNHGLSAGGGAPAVAYSGLQGNKLEQLGNQQRQIAQQRMQTNLQRLTQAQSAVNQGQTLANSALSTQESNNFQGVNDYNNMLSQSLQAAAANQAQMNTGFNQVSETSGPGMFGNILGGGLGSFVGKGAGVLGTAAAGSLGGSSGKTPSSTTAAGPAWGGNSTDPNETGFMGPVQPS